MKSFGNWDIQDLSLTFGLDKVEHLPTLTNWLQASFEVSAQETSVLNQLQERLDALGEDWNEDELKMNFISPIMLLVGYGIKNNYNYFFQRGITATVQGTEMSGIVDMVIASGWTKPTKPYFFLHEYKQDQANKGSARAQLLAAMLAAQSSNANEKPLFGVYLIGASWRFVVLEGKNYAVKRFDATEKEDLFQIFAMLKWIKVYIEKDLGLI